MDELVDILNSEGGYTGKQAMKSQAHKKGLFHPTVHVWLYTRNGQILLQKRGRKKKSFPLLWDVSVAGHVEAGEEIIKSALRETEEEIGLRLLADDLEKVGVFKSGQVHSHKFKDFEFHNCFIAELRVPLEELVKQESEVEDLKLIPMMTFAEEVWGLARSSEYVPHGTSYYKKVIQAIMTKLKGFDKSGNLT